MSEEETIERGLEILARLEYRNLPLAAVMNRIELVTNEPRLQHRILQEAERQEILTRTDAGVQITTHTFLRFDSDVVSREGAFTCRRCGSSLSTGYFMRLPSGEFGPFGSSCIRKVTGRA